MTRREGPGITKPPGILQSATPGVKTKHYTPLTTSIRVIFCMSSGVLYEPKFKNIIPKGDIEQGKETRCSLRDSESRSGWPGVYNSSNQLIPHGGFRN